MISKSGKKGEKLSESAKKAKKYIVRKKKFVPLQAVFIFFWNAGTSRISKKQPHSIVRPNNKEAEHKVMPKQVRGQKQKTKCQLFNS
jgi:hypothetical protein